MAVPGQRPLNANFTVISGTRAVDEDMYAREVFGVQNFTDLATDIRDKSRLLADDAAYEVTNIAQWWHFEEEGFTNTVADKLLEEFNEVFRLMWIQRGIRMFRSEEQSDAYQKNVVGPMLLRTVDHLNSQGTQGRLADADSYDDPFSINIMLRSLISILVKQRTPVIPAVNDAARTIREEFVKLWEARRWTFRVRHTTFTIQADGSILLPEGVETQFDGFASKNIWINGTGSSRSTCIWLDSNRFAGAKAYYESGITPSTGLPRYFFWEDRGTIQVIHWVPTPDQAYTAFANILIKAPNFAVFADDSSDNNGLNNMPSPFRHHLRDRCVARLLSRYGREDTDAARWLQTVDAEFQEMADNWAERGAEASSVVPQAGDRMLRQQTSHRGSSIIGQIE